MPRNGNCGRVRACEPRIVGGEAAEIGWVGATKAVDGLIGIADRAQIRRRSRGRQQAPPDPDPATGSAAVNPAAQPATNLQEAVLSSAGRWPAELPVESQVQLEHIDGRFAQETNISPSHEFIDCRLDARLAYATA